MLKKIFFLVLIFPFTIVAQKFDLSWNNLDSVAFGNTKFASQTFEGCEFLDGSRIPYFTYSKVLSEEEGKNLSYNVDFNILEETAVGDDFSISQSEYTIFSKVISSRNSYALKVIITPFRNENNEHFRLKSFELDITSTQKVKSKSSSVWFSSQSVLNDGTWVKLGVKADGIYKLTYSELSDLGIDPSEVSIFTANSGQLSTMIDDFTDDLKEIPIYDNGSYILFYANDHNDWYYNESTTDYRLSSHHFWNENYYYLTDSKSGDHKRVEDSEEVMGTPTLTYTSFLDYASYAPQDVNIGSTGDDWFSNQYSASSLFNHNFSFDAINNVSSKVILQFAYLSSGSTSYMECQIDDTFRENITLSSSGSNFFSFKSRSYTVTPSSNTLSIDLIPSSGLSTFSYWLDYIFVNVNCPLDFSGNSLSFRNLPTSNNYVSYDISNTTANTLIWDVTDPFNTQSLPSTQLNGKISFVSKGNEVKEFIAVDVSASFSKPTVIETVDNQNLHGEDVPNMVIISPVEFFPAAERLADIHRAEGLSVLVINQEKIFNEFSGGKADVTAIRWFLKMFYDRSTEENSLDYVLLFGDASYDNRMYKSGSSVVMTYESDDSNTETGTFVSDDYFGLLDDSEGNGPNISNSDLIDLGIGRIPVNSLSEAEDVVRKIELYLTESSEGTWRNTACFVADDENSNAHIESAEYSSQNLLATNSAIAVKKVYIDAFNQEQQADGARYPDAKAMSDNFLNDGVLIWSYAGHGSPDMLADEVMMTKKQIQEMDNGSVLPFWLTATCDFCPFDHNEESSAGEEILLNPSGGGIGTLSTTRLVYINQNEIMTRSFFDYLLAEDPSTGDIYRIGDALRLSKKSIGTGSNKRKYCLIGDPALRLLTAHPKWDVITESINGINCEEFTDTVSALSMVTIKGYIQTGTSIDTDFNGTIYPTVYDKIVTFSTLGNDSDSDIQTFTSWYSTVFKGKSTVENGRFEFSFMVPKDIDYTSGKGRIEYYAISEDGDANGIYDELYIGDFNEDYVLDTVGPTVAAFLNSYDFENGETVNNSPMFIADITDKSGINTTGSAVGHDIILKLNNDPYSIVNLNNSYESEEGDYTKGTVRYKFNDLEEGDYTLTLKVWDVQNNSTLSEINFKVKDALQPNITDLISFPNPVSLSNNDVLTIQATHDRFSETFTTTFELFSIDGRLLYQTSENISSSGNTITFEMAPSNIAIAGGLYYYRLSIDDGISYSEGKAQKLLIID